MSSSSKTKGQLFILAPIVILIVTLFLRVIISFFMAEGSSANPALVIVKTLLSLIALTCMILVPIGIIMLAKAESQTVVGNQALAGRGDRWLAKLCDSFILFFLAPAITVIFIENDGGTVTTISTTIFLVIILSIGIIQSYYLTTQGQTIAKKWLKIRIVDAKTQRVGGFVKNVLLRSVLNYVFFLIPFYSIVDSLFIFREDRRCIHDLLAGTIVVKANEQNRKPSSKSPAKFCTSCGTKVKLHAKFCAICGKPLL